MKRAPRSRQRHDLYAKYHDYDSEISDLLGECGMIGHGDLDNRDAALREKAGNLTIPGACIPMVKNHQCLIEGPAVCDSCPDNIVLFDISGNVRWKFEPFGLSFKTLIVAARLIEKG